MSMNVKELMTTLSAELEAERQVRKATNGSTRNGASRTVQTVEWYAAQTKDELVRLKNNWASAKSNAKKDGKTAEFDIAVGEIDKLNQVMDKTGHGRTGKESAIYSLTGVDLKAKDADGNYVIDDKKLTALIKVSQSHKCVAKKIGDMALADRILKIEQSLSAERARRNPDGPSSGTRMKSKAEVNKLIEQLEVIANDTDDEALLDEVQLRIETLQWVVGTLE